MKEKIYLYLSAYLPPIIWAAVIFFLSNQPTLPGFELSAIDFFFKKIAHIVVFGVLYFLFFRASNLTMANNTNKKNPTSVKIFSPNFYLPLLLTFSYAIIDEIHQSFIPGRTSTLRDIGYDSLGILIVFLRIYRYI